MVLDNHLPPDIAVPTPLRFAIFSYIRRCSPSKLAAFCPTSLLAILVGLEGPDTHVYTGDLLLLDGSSGIFTDLTLQFILHAASTFLPTITWFQGGNRGELTV